MKYRKKFPNTANNVLIYNVMIFYVLIISQTFPLLDQRVKHRKLWLLVNPVRSFCTVNVPSNCKSSLQFLLVLSMY